MFHITAAFLLISFSFTIQFFFFFSAQFTAIQSSLLIFEEQCNYIFGSIIYKILSMIKFKREYLLLPAKKQSNILIYSLSITWLLSL